MKGILNKLTPENFDRLLQQVLDIVNDAELLHVTIRLVFENAVAQPTFSFMYAQLCDKLSKVGLLGPEPCLAHLSRLLAFMSSQTPGARALSRFLVTVTCICGQRNTRGFHRTIDVWHDVCAGPARVPTG